VSASAEARTEPAIRGFVDGLTGNQIDGWAFEVAHPTERVVVELRLDGERVATTVADRHRADLVRSGVGDAFHGFRFPLKPAWAERRSELAVIARGVDGTEVTLPLFRRGAPVAPPAPAPAPEAPPPQLVKAIEQLVANQRLLEGRLQDLAARVPVEPVPAAVAAPPPPIAFDAGEAEARLAALEAWVARLDERLATLQAAPSGMAKQPAGLDTWQVVLIALLGLVGLGALAAFALVLAI
jgi:hypothetical protein